jgi:hypothetical protein
MVSRSKQPSLAQHSLYMRALILGLMLRNFANWLAPLLIEEIHATWFVLIVKAAGTGSFVIYLACLMLG